MYLKKIAEEVIRRYEQGDPSRDSRLELRELYVHIVQAINKNIKAEHFNVNMPLGEYVPPYAALATYDLTPIGTSFKTVEFTRTTFDAPLTDQYYVHPNGQFWMTEGGDFWVAAPASATMTIAQITGSTFTVTISGFPEVNGIEYEDIADFFNSNSTYIDDTRTPGYIEIQGIEGVNTIRFATDGIISASTTGDGWFFVYNLSQTVDTDDEILQLVETSHQSIGNEVGDNPITFVSLDLYTLTTNTVEEVKATATLPTQPIQLPRGMGVWKVYSNRDRNNPFIPLGSNDGFIHGGVLSDSIALANTYEYFDNKTLQFNVAASNLPDDLKVQLVVVDMEQIGETDLLPIPADMEEQVIVDVLNIVGRRQTEDSSNDGNPDIR